MNELKVIRNNLNDGKNLTFLIVKSSFSESQLGVYYSNSVIYFRVVLVTLVLFGLNMKAIHSLRTLMNHMRSNFYLDSIILKKIEVIEMY